LSGLRAWPPACSPEQTDKEFFEFTLVTWGIRALARTFIAYQDKVGLKNIKEMIGRWAPPNENDTGAYVRVVAGSVGVDADQTTYTHDYETLRPLTLAIIRMRMVSSPIPMRRSMPYLCWPGWSRRSDLSRKPARSKADRLPPARRSSH
jgi:hypothetical protein